jgi:purine-binding chemotaxis protein CheW
MTTSSPAPHLDDLLARAARLERELFDLERALASAGAGTPRPGLHLVVEAGGHLALLEARAVVQIARVVEFTPIPGAPAAVLGGFVRRGRPAVAVDLARALGVAREPDLDAHLVIVDGARLLGVVVDRVQHVIEAPARADPRAERVLPRLGDDLATSWCHLDGRLLPLIDGEALARLAAGGDPEGEPARPAGGEGAGT